MNAIQFIKEHGVDKARDVVVTCHGIPYYTFKEKTEHGYSACKSVDLVDLKRLVESVDLIHANGGLNGTKNTVKLFQSSLDIGLYHGVEVVNAEDEIPRLKQAIADYESIGGEHV